VKSFLVRLAGGYQEKRAESGAPSRYKIFLTGDVPGGLRKVVLEGRKKAWTMKGKGWRGCARPLLLALLVVLTPGERVAIRKKPGVSSIQGIRI
jgi:hypothetical protein